MLLEVCIKQNDVISFDKYYGYACIKQIKIPQKVRIRHSAQYYQNIQERHISLQAKEHDEPKKVLQMRLAVAGLNCQQSYRPIGLPSFTKRLQGSSTCELWKLGWTFWTCFETSYIFNTAAHWTSQVTVHFRVILKSWYAKGQCWGISMIHVSWYVSWYKKCIKYQVSRYIIVDVSVSVSLIH